MACKKNISSKSAKACIGGMSHRILIQKRNLEYRSSESRYTFTTTWTRWADIATTSGLRKFNGININEVPSHTFIIRTIDALTSEYWINYKSNYYRILSSETVSEGSFQKIYCRLTGEDDLDGSES